MADFHDSTPRPELVLDQHGELVPFQDVPEGWTAVVLGAGEDSQVVLCGWTNDGVFHQYAETETIVRALFNALEGNRG